MRPLGGTKNDVSAGLVVDRINATLNITDDWYEDLNDVYDHKAKPLVNEVNHKTKSLVSEANTLDPEDSVNERDMQIDNRYMVLNENDE